MGLHHIDLENSAWLEKAVLQGNRPDSGRKTKALLMKRFESTAFILYRVNLSLQSFPFPDFDQRHFYISPERERFTGSLFLIPGCLIRGRHSLDEIETVGGRLSERTPSVRRVSFFAGFQEDGLSFHSRNFKRQILC